MNAEQELDRIVEGVRDRAQDNEPRALGLYPKQWQVLLQAIYADRLEHHVIISVQGNTAHVEAADRPLHVTILDYDTETVFEGVKVDSDGNFVAVTEEGALSVDYVDKLAYIASLTEAKQ